MGFDVASCFQETINEVDTEQTTWQKIPWQSYPDSQREQNCMWKSGCHERSYMKSCKNFPQAQNDVFLIPTEVWQVIYLKDF